MAGREAGPTITITRPRSYIGRSTPLAVTSKSPTEIAGDHRSTSSRTARPVALSDLKIDRAGGRLVMPAHDRARRTGQRSGDAGRRCQPQDVLRPADGHQPRRRATSSCASIRRGCRSSPSITSSTSAAPSSSCCARRRRTSKPACRSAMRAIRFYPGSAVGLSDPAVRVGFFALRHDQDINTRITAYARDAAGNEATTPVEHQPFVKKFVQSKIPIDQRFLDRVVPGDRLEHAGPEGRYRLARRTARRASSRSTATCARRTATTSRRWRRRASRACCGPKRSRRWATRRSSRASPIAAPTYFDDKEIDKQVHLGFDLAIGAAGAGARVERRRRASTPTSSASTATA